MAAQKLGGTKRQKQCSHAPHCAHFPRDRSCPSTLLEATGCSTNHARNPQRSRLQAPSDPRQRSRRQSIHIGHALGGGFVQSIFRPPPRRPPFECLPSVSRRDAGLKMLCIMWPAPLFPEMGFSGKSVVWDSGSTWKRGWPTRSPRLGGPFVTTSRSAIRILVKYTQIFKSTSHCRQ